MAIGTLAAIGIAGAVGGSILGSRSQAKAAKKAGRIAQNTATENNTLAREFYGKNEGYLSPYIQSGQAANGLLNDFIGIQQPQQAVQPQMQAQFSPQSFGGQGFAGQQYGYEGLDGAQGAPNAFGGFAGGFGGGVPQGAPQGQVQPNAASQFNSGDAFRRYIANSDYGFQLGEGMNRVNSGYAGNGTLQSGAAVRGAEDYRQNLQTGYRGEFANLLGNQQGVGLSAGSALAGVGQNFVNTISANNNSAGTAAANAALTKGANNPFANALSLAGGAAYGLGRK